MDWELLQGLPEEEADQVLAAGRRRRFARREMIWHEGDRADTFHVIRSGRIAIQGTTSEGNLVTMAILGPGGAAGLLAVHGSEAYHTSEAVALEATETLAIRIDDFVEFRRRIPALNEAVIRLVRPGPEPLPAAGGGPVRLGRCPADPPPADAVRGLRARGWRSGHPPHPGGPGQPGRGNPAHGESGAEEGRGPRDAPGRPGLHRHPGPGSPVPVR